MRKASAGAARLITSTTSGTRVSGNMSACSRPPSCDGCGAIPCSYHACPTIILSLADYVAINKPLAYRRIAYSRLLFTGVLR